MKSLLLALLLFQAALTNKDVLDMLKDGLSPEIIVAKIKSSPNTFDTSPATLKELKDANVPEAVILAMVEKPVERADSVLVPEGTPVDVEVLEDLSSEFSAEGDPVTFKVRESVVIDGRVAIKAGAIAKGKITLAERTERRGKAGVLRVEVTHAVAVDGQKIKLSGEQSAKGRDKSQRSTALAIQGNVYAGMVTGEKARIKAGRVLHVYTNEDKKITVRP